MSLDYFKQEDAKSWIVANFEMCLFICICPILVILALCFYENEQDFNAWGGTILLLGACSIPPKTKKVGDSKYFGTLFLIAIFIYLAYNGDLDDDEIAYEVEIAYILGWGGLLLFILSSIFGRIPAIYAYKNFDEVVSRRMLYLNSNVSLFEKRWSYAFDRFTNISCAIFYTIVAIAFLVCYELKLFPFQSV